MSKSMFQNVPKGVYLCADKLDPPTPYGVKSIIDLPKQPNGLCEIKVAIIAGPCPYCSRSTKNKSP